MSEVEVSLPERVWAHVGRDNSGGGGDERDAAGRHGDDAPFLSSLNCDHHDHSFNTKCPITQLFFEQLHNMSLCSDGKAGKAVDNFFEF